MTQNNCFKTQHCWRRDLLLRQFASFAQLPFPLAKELMQLLQHYCTEWEKCKKGYWKALMKCIINPVRWKIFQIKCKILLFWGYFWVENLGSKNPACGKEMINMKYGFTQSKDTMERFFTNSL